MEIGGKKKKMRICWKDWRYLFYWKIAICADFFNLFQIIDSLISMESLEFSSIEFWAVTEFLFLQKRTPKEINQCMVQTLIPLILYSKMVLWQFLWHQFAVVSSTVSTHSICGQIQDLNLGDRWISTKIIVRH